MAVALLHVATIHSELGADFAGKNGIVLDFFALFVKIVHDDVRVNGDGVFRSA